MLQVNGLAVIPTESNLAITPVKSGSYFNFRLTTQDRKEKFQYWNASLWVATENITEWQNKLKPGNIFYIETAFIESSLVSDGKYLSHTIRLNISTFRQLTTPFWIKK